MTPPPFSIAPRWKEEVVYTEAEHHVFYCGWGIQPPVLYVPSAADWDRVMPPFLRGRRELILDRLRQYSGHVLEEEPSVR